MCGEKANDCWKQKWEKEVKGRHLLLVQKRRATDPRGGQITEKRKE